MNYLTCPTCANTTFKIHDVPPVPDPDGCLEHVIECTKCGLSFTLGFEDEDEEVQTH